jgi:DNA-binding NarL/FixJ family response regulator
VLRRKILLVDDQQLFVECLRSTISTLAPDAFTIEVMYDVPTALRSIEQQRPSIILMDVQLPGMNGIKAVKHIHERYPEIKILMLSAFGFDDYVRDALQNGASGYLLKDIQPKALIEELSRVGGDKIVLSKGAGSLGEPGKPGTRSGSMPFPKWLLDLNEKERKILLYLSQGFSNQEIAEKVYLGNQTVRNYLSTIYLKMGVETRYEAILRAVSIHIEDLVEGGP